MLHVFLGFVSALTCVETAVLYLIQTKTFPITSSYLHYIAVLSIPWLTHIPSFSKATQATMMYYSFIPGPSGPQKLTFVSPGACSPRCYCSSATATTSAGRRGLQGCQLVGSSQIKSQERVSQHLCSYSSDSH